MNDAISLACDESWLEARAALSLVECVALLKRMWPGINLTQKRLSNAMQERGIKLKRIRKSKKIPIGLLKRRREEFLQKQA